MADVTDAREVRALIARAILGGEQTVASTLGSVTLREHQCVAAARLIALIQDASGALLADRVGVGKTFTALAVANHFGTAPTILAPASLRSMWREAMEASGVTGLLLSHESLSRGASFAASDGIVIVDEAHRFRSPASRRYEMLSASLRGTRALLVSATPIHNKRSDLCAQLALFLGRRAWAMTDEELAAFVVRGDVDGGDDGRVPDLNGPLPITLGVDDDCLDEIVGLPTPVVARDESIAAALVSFGLVHQWASSRAALIASLRRRRTKGLALLAALDSGRYPSRAELSAWTHLGDAMQLAFPELVVTTESEIGDRHLLCTAVERHLAGLDGLLARCRAAPDPDDERAELLARLLDVHRGERIIAFCHYAETVEALRARLAGRAGIATLTARGARVASGRVSRDMVLSQFTPNDARRHVDAAQRIDLLIATDLLSEGLNLQEASVVVHLDLPWNPARLDQRVGRVRRLGSRHGVVTVYSFSPPASAERLLKIQDRLREKLCVAQHTVGVAGRILPPLFVLEQRNAPGLAERLGTVDRVLREWSVAVSPHLRSIRPAFGAVTSAVAGLVAAVHDGDRCHLVADVGNGIGNDSNTIAAALHHAAGPNAAVEASDFAVAGARIEAYLRARCANTAIDFGAAASARARRATLARVAQTIARAPRHRRSVIVPLADAARAVVTTPLGEGAERVLDMLVRAEMPDEAWLRSIATFGALNARQARQPSAHAAAEIVAVLLLVN
jgi:superfamily II DNA or RNA helicase